MASLRRRLSLATAALLALQATGTTLGFVSWRSVQSALAQQERIGEERATLLQLGQAARELYVHQAHTFIEGGPGHLDHLDRDVELVLSALRAAEAGEDSFVALDLAPVRAAIEGSTAWFAATVVPAAQAGQLDRARATELHNVAEDHAATVQARVGDALAQLAAAEAAEVERLSRETRRAWMAVATVLVAGLAAGAIVSAQLARSILGPVDALRTAVRAFARGEPAVAPAGGDDELAELGHAFNDMTARVREAEASRVERERVQALGEIAGAVAHELLSPVAAILAETRADPIDPARIRAEADHARRVIQGLLGYARPGEAEPTDVRVDEAAAAAVERAVPFADALGLNVRWAGGPPATLLAAPTAVRQVLDNLVRNALDASSASGAEVEVEVVGNAVEVRDRGPGIPPTVRARLYQPFATGRAEGTGLGLAVSQRIAGALGGRIVHLDRAGGGTVARWELS